MTRLQRHVLVVGLALCAPRAVRAADLLRAPAASPDSAAIVRAVESMYLAATNDDLALFHAVVTPDFFAFDGGKRFDGDELMQLVQSLHASGKVYVWRVTEPRVQVFGEAALITYVNRGAIADDAGKKEVAWLESAVLEKHNGAWRIRFFHSTRVP